MVAIGVDPGLTGAIALACSHRGLLAWAVGLLLVVVLVAKAIRRRRRWQPDEHRERRGI